MKGCVVVTGAAGGIGQALVRSFTGAGFEVVGSDLGDAPAGLPCAAWLAADLARSVDDESYADACFERLRALVGGRPLKALIHNAALQVLAPTEALTRQDWAATLNVNLLAPFLWTQALLPELEAARGCVVHVSSIHARLTKKRFVAYATSKAALSGMTRAMALDLGGRVRVNAIEPAAIATPMLKAGFEGKPALYAQLEGCHPAGRIGSPDEVAACALAIVDGAMDFLHGACIALDGGISGRLMDPD